MRLAWSIQNFMSSCQIHIYWSGLVQFVRQWLPHHWTTQDTDTVHCGKSHTLRIWSVDFRVLSIFLSLSSSQDVYWYFSSSSPRPSISSRPSNPLSTLLVPRISLLLTIVHVCLLYLLPFCVQSIMTGSDRAYHRHIWLNILDTLLVYPTDPMAWPPIIPKVASEGWWISVLLLA